MITLTGGCYCGEVRFEATGPVQMKGLCLCRSCQINSGGMGNLFTGLMDEDFRYTKGAPARFAHPDKPDAPIREFCGTCGTPLAARSPKAPAGVIVKIGALDDPAAVDGPDIVVWTQEALPYHCIPASARAFPRFPVR